MYVYWWHVGELRAFKVGHADDPRQHVSDYRSEYGSGGEDVRGYELESGIDAEWVEGQLCRMLETKGLRRAAFWSRNGEEEFFVLGGRTFEDVHELLFDAARHIDLAEVSNQRKRQRRDEPEVAQVSTPDQQEQEMNRVHEEPRPRRHYTSASSPFAVTALLGLFLIGAIVVWSMATGLGGDRLAPSPGSANLAEQESPLIATTAIQDGDSSVRPRRNAACTLVEFSDTLVHVSCAGSWASMRWNGQWVFDDGYNESDALAFFSASDVARRVVAMPSREPVPQLPERVEVGPEQLPQSNQPFTPAVPPPQPHIQQAAPRSATVQPQPPQETPLPRKQCTVSRPKPGYQVYLVTCPNSQATIGRTVNSATSWTVSESVNGTEAIEFS